MMVLHKYILPALLFLCVSCSYNPTAGGGSDLPDMKIAQGSIYNEDNSPASHTRVMLVPANHNPVKQGQISDSLCDTTDAYGNYQFVNVSFGVYNLQATHLFEGTKSLLPGIVIKEDTSLIRQAVMKSTGTLKIILPETVDTVRGYIFLQGTTESKNLSEALPLDDGGFSIVFDSLPEATFTHILYDVHGDPQEPTLISDTVVVSANDTAVSEAFVFWAEYTAANSGLPGNEVRSLCLMPDGSVWIGTLSGAALLNRSGWTLYNKSNSGLPDNSVFDIKCDPNGTIWFATFGGLASLNGSSWTTYTTAQSPIPSNEISSLVLDNNNVLWMATYKGGLVSFDGTQWRVYNTANSSIPSNDLNILYIDEKDNKWVGTTQHGLAKFNGATWTVYNSSNSGIWHGSVYSIAEDNNGDMWIGYGCGGVSRFDGVAWRFYYLQESPLLYCPIYAITKDSFGSLWFGTGSGITRYDGTQWKDYNGEQYKLLHAKGVFVLTADSNNNRWVGTLSRGLIAFGPGIKKRL